MPSKCCEIESFGHIAALMIALLAQSPVIFRTCCIFHPHPKGPLILPFLTCYLQQGFGVSFDLELHSYPGGCDSKVGTSDSFHCGILSLGVLSEKASQRTFEWTCWHVPVGLEALDSPSYVYKHGKCFG